MEETIPLARPRHTRALNTHTRDTHHRPSAPADVPVAEQELPAEVTLLDHVVVRHDDAPALRAPASAADAHEGKVLQKLAAQGACAHQEQRQA